MTIILIGMPGCGKSCMGRVLSKKLRKKVIDTDRMIFKKDGRPLQQIIDEEGLDGFKKIEEEVLLSIRDIDLIVSTGGSAIYYPEAMKHLKEIGKVVYLYCSLKTIKERLGDFSKRGVAL